MRTTSDDRGVAPVPENRPWWAPIGARLRPRRGDVLADVIAGLTFAAVNVPQGMANALLANVNPIAGVYTLIVATPIAALFTGSVFMNVSTTNALSVTAGSIVTGVPPQDRLAVMATLALLAGILQIAGGLLRMGWLVRFVPYSVLTGFMNGVAVVIILSQLGDATAYRGLGPNRLLQTLDLLAHAREVRLQSVAVALFTIAVIMILSRTRLKKAAMILALAGAALLVALLSPDGVRLVGHVAQIQRTLPQPGWPALVLNAQTLVAAVAIAIVGLVQAAGVSKSYPNPDGRYAKVEHDFIGQGAANIAASLCQGIPVGGSISSTALNVSAGARSRWTNIFGGLFVALIVLLLANLVALIPLPALAGLLIVIGFNSLQIAQGRTVLQTGPVPAAAMLLTFGATLVLPLQYAVLLGVGIAVVLNAFHQANRVRVVQVVLRSDGSAEELPAPHELPGGQATLLMLYGSLDFAAAATVAELLPALEYTRHAVAVLTLRGRSEVGSTFINVIKQYALQLQRCDSQLMLAGLDPELLRQLERTGTRDLLGPENVFPAQPRFFASSGQALQAAEAWLHLKSEV